MDKQKQIEEMAKVYDDATLYARNYLGSLNNAGKWYGNAFYNAGYRKIPEGAVVLTREEHQKYLAFKIIEPQVRGCLDRERELQKQVDELKLENTELYKERTILIAGSILEKQDIVRETAEKFAERLKTECFDGGIDDKWVAVSFSRLDEICKEITEGERDGRM